MRRGRARAMPGPMQKKGCQAGFKRLPSWGQVGRPALTQQSTEDNSLCARCFPAPVAVLQEEQRKVGSTPEWRKGLPKQRWQGVLLAGHRRCH